MADDKSSAGSSAGKRPYATLDLKATEIENTPAKGQSSPETAKGLGADVPLPAAARSYAETSADAEAKADTSTPKFLKSDSAKSSASAGASASAAGGARDDDDEEDIVIRKRGGFFSHLAAGIAGGALALLAYQWGLPQLGFRGSDDVVAALTQRLAAIEKAQSAPLPAPDLSSIEFRLSDLETQTKKIPAITESQNRLVAETKAALASAASDAGSPQLIERVGKVEDKFKALADAGVNDPNANRIEQLAALTGKVSDLETSLSTQLTALRVSVAKDVEGRVQAATEASEAARSGTQRIDKDVAGLKTDNVRIETAIAAVKTAADHIAADLKVAQDETQSLKNSFEGLKTAAAKPADITAAVQPLTDRTAALEKSVQGVVQGDAARQESAQRVVLALELQNLRRALDSGENFSSQLADVKKVAGNTVDLSALESLKETGVPSLADLTKDFRSAADNAIDADAEPDNATVVDRLWAGAKSVVRVRRVDLKADDKSTEAIVGRMQVALNDGRLPDVLEAAKELSPKAQDAARPFLDKVAARVSVDKALADLESQLKSSIATGSQQTAKPSP
ncbi:COG4223 family protein [Hyphomicrobium sp. 2TAF46]|uniref:COG4223 family protein n=1 Tax=Hyphomicrobium sp. 2TAF46 TaxID=3233019 RepID=UPI003F907FF9